METLSNRLVYEIKSLGEQPQHPYLLRFETAVPGEANMSTRVWVDDVIVRGGLITAVVGTADAEEVVAIFPATTPWFMVHRDRLTLLPQAQMFEAKVREHVAWRFEQEAISKEIAAGYTQEPKPDNQDWDSFLRELGDGETN